MDDSDDGKTGTAFGRRRYLFSRTTSRPFAMRPFHRLSPGRLETIGRYRAARDKSLSSDSSGREKVEWATGLTSGPAGGEGAGPRRTGLDYVDGRYTTERTKRERERWKVGGGGPEERKERRGPTDEQDERRSSRSLVLSACRVVSLQAPFARPRWHGQSRETTPRTWKS